MVAHVDATRKSGLTDRIAAFVSALEPEDVPAQALETAERCFIDTIGVTIAGSVEGAGAAAAHFADMTGATSASEATLIGHSERASVSDAAFVNGTAAHGLDFDDGSDGFGGHPSASIVPALLAVGEGLEVSGEELLTAYVAGFEAGCYLSSTIIPSPFEAGWHTTGTMGAFASTAGVCRLLELDRDATGMALGITASMAGGLLENLGTMTKPLHCGHAARAGVTAALLASNEFTSSPGAVDGDRGFLSLYRGAEPVSDPGYAIGSQWAIIEEGVDIKQYPSCYFTHAGMHLASELVETHDLDMADIDAIEITISEGGVDSLTYDDPSTPLEAKFSMPYMVASKLVQDRVDFRIFRDEYLTDQGIQRVQEKVEIAGNPDLPHTSFDTEVCIRMHEGAEYTSSLGQYPGPPGKATNPLSDEQLREKFLMCVERVMSRDAAEGLHETLTQLRTGAALTDITDQLEPRQGA